MTHWFLWRAFGSSGYMARIFQTPSMGEANVRVAVVADRDMADLLVHRVSSWGMARGDALWFITPNRHDATTIIHLCSVGMSDVRVHFVDHFSEAGWVRRHPMQGRLR